MLVVFVVVSPYFLYQAVRYKKYIGSLRQRLGYLPISFNMDGEESIWIHAVSVGEVLAVAGLIAQIRQAFPQHRIVISSTTDTGHTLAQKRFGAENSFYFPLDFAFAIRPYLRALRPELVVLAETEFWPNFMRLAHASGARIAVVNARISDRSWPNYRRFTWALRKILRNVDLFLAQTQQDSERLQAIGADSTRVRTTGNLKFDVNLPSPPPILEPLRQALDAEAAGPVLVCGSTVEDEERLLLKAFENILVKHPTAVMILAPRHPERFQTVAGIIQQMAIPFHLRSRWSREPLAGSVFLVDTIGELAALYGLADLAFVRYIGHPRMEVNEPLLAFWAQHMARWLQQGLTLYVFCHCPFEKLSPDICATLYQRVRALLPLPPLPWQSAGDDTEPEQPRLF